MLPWKTRPTPNLGCLSWRSVTLANMLSLVDGEGCFVMLHFGYSSMIDFPELKLWGQGVNFDRLLMHVAKSPPPAIPGSTSAFL